jgi:hypothetical protein
MLKGLLFKFDTPYVVPRTLRANVCGAVPEQTCLPSKSVLPNPPLSKFKSIKLNAQYGIATTVCLPFPTPESPPSVTFFRGRRPHVRPNNARAAPTTCGPAHVLRGRWLPRRVHPHNAPRRLPTRPPPRTLHRTPRPPPQRLPPPVRLRARAE